MASNVWWFSNFCSIETRLRCKYRQVDNVRYGWTGVSFGYVIATTGQQVLAHVTPCKEGYTSAAYRVAQSALLAPPARDSDKLAQSNN